MPVALTGSDYLDLFGDDEVTARAKADAMAGIVRQRRAAGQLASVLGGMTGDKGLMQIAQQEGGAAAQGNDDLMGVGRQRVGLRQALAQQAQRAQDQAERTRQFDAELALRKRGVDLDAARLGLERSRMEQDNWTAVADPVSGGVVMLNRKTGESRAIGPVGQGTPSGGMSLAPLKPAQIESDIQSLGKDVEPIAKAKPDIDALARAAKQGDVAGFGPVEGRIPDMVAASDAVANRQAAGRLMASIIQATSGQAASEKEVARLLEANGMGRTATDDQLRLGVAQLERQYQSLLKQREAKYRPEVVQEYARRGGFTSSAIPQTSPGTTPLETGRIRVRRKSDGKVGSMPANRFNADIYERL